VVASDADICQHLVGYVADKRFMTAETRDEIGDHVLTSVQNVRKYAVNARYLPANKWHRLPSRRSPLLVVTTRVRRSRAQIHKSCL
jgi:hypothetical protein